jgi:hypothetical protein
MKKEQFNRILFNEVKRHFESNCDINILIYESQLKEKINNIFNFDTLLEQLHYDDLENFNIKRNNSLFGAYLSISFTIRFYINNTYDKINYNTSLKIAL